MNPLIETLMEGSAHWEHPLTGGQLDALNRYYEMLVQANTFMNLTAVTQPREAALRHFLDSLCPPALAVLPPGASVIDVGSGAGLPGLPLAIVRPDLTVTLAEARGKKADFIASVIDALGLPRAKAVWGRAEELGRDPAHRERYDAALARAVAPLPTLCEYLLPFVRVGGVMLAWKGAAAADEARAAEPAFRLLGGGSPSLFSYAISHEFCHLSLIVCDKSRHTPTQYPRQSGKPSKDPLIRF